MSEPPFRMKVHGCSHRSTYKYFFRKEDVSRVWTLLEGAYGTVRYNHAFHTKEIDGGRLVFRSTMLSNPITVYIHRDCSDGDVARFHELVGFERDDVTT